jgi:hypothetical protein
MSEAKPTAAERLQGVEVKLDRARKHLDELIGRLAVYAHREPYRLVTQVEDEGRKLVFVFELVEKPFPEWGVIIGDFIHNLRSALDHLAYQVVDANGGTVSGDVKFPIYKCKTSYCGWRKGRKRHRDPLAGVNARAIDAFEQEQPYRRKDTGDDPASHPLAIINKLWNDDKHKLLIPAIFRFRDPPTAPTAPPGAPAESVVLSALSFWCSDFKVAESGNEPPPFSDAAFQIGRLDDGERLVEFSGRVTGPHPQIHMKGELSVHVGFADGSPLIETLITFFDEVFYLVERFRPLL